MPPRPRSAPQGPAKPPLPTLQEALDAATEQAIFAALEAHEGNATHAARALDISHRSFCRYVERLALGPAIDARWPTRHPGPPRGPRNGDPKI